MPCLLRTCSRLLTQTTPRGEDSLELEHLAHVLEHLAYVPGAVHRVIGLARDLLVEVGGEPGLEHGL